MEDEWDWGTRWAGPEFRGRLGRAQRPRELSSMEGIYKMSGQRNLRKAALYADGRRAYKSSSYIRTMDRYFNQLKESGGADFLKGAKHCLSAKPWYMRYYHDHEVAPGAELTGASSGVRRKRPGVKYDPNGVRSSLRMVTNVRGNVKEYVHATETDLATSIQ